MKRPAGRSPAGEIMQVSVGAGDGLDAPLHGPQAEMIVDWMGLLDAGKTKAGR